MPTLHPPSDEAISFEAAMASEKFYLARHETEPYADVRVERDVHYGPGDRQKLDVYIPEGNGSGRPVMVFVHGGNFVGGDKSRSGSPYYDNVGLWAARRGYVGVIITYRLAPQFDWPTGALDVAAAVARVVAGAADWGGDPQWIVLVGASAGAFHVADYLTRFRNTGDGVRGAALLSGIYDPAAFEDRGVLIDYLGEDDNAWPTPSLDLLLPQSGVPLLIGVAEYDPVRYHKQASLAIAAVHNATGKLPHIAWVAGHSHLTEIHHLNAEESTLGANLGAFIDAVTEGRPQ